MATDDTPSYLPDETIAKLHALARKCANCLGKPTGCRLQRDSAATRAAVAALRRAHAAIGAVLTELEPNPWRIDADLGRGLDMIEAALEEAKPEEPS